MLNNQNKFNFFVPFELQKGKDNNGKDVVWIEGVASSATKDSDSETLIPSGFDFTPLLKTGFFNFNHKANNDPSAIIGEPTEAKVINNGKDFWVKGFIYPEGKGLETIQLAERLERYSPNRRLGFSIEGQAMERDSFDNRKITKARITSIAITHCPKNPNTLMQLIKGEYSEPFIEDEEKEDEDKKEKAITTETIAPVTPESVEHDPKDISTNFVSNKKNNNFTKELKKSEVFNLIVQKFPNCKTAELKQIYSFVKNVSQKDFNMENITPEAISKAFDILNEATEAIVKSEDAEKKEETVEEVNEDEVAKAMETANILFKSGMDKEAACDILTKGGIALNVAQTAVDRVIAEAEKANAVNEPVQVEAPIIKAEEINELIKSEITKATQLTAQEITKGFEGVGQIIKSLQTSNEELKQSNALLVERLNRIENSPLPVKSATNINAIDKFAKSEDANRIEGVEYINVNNKQDLKKLVTLIDAANDEIISKGYDSDPLLVKAIEAIEIAGQVPEQVYPRLRAMNIILQK